MRDTDRLKAPDPDLSRPAWVWQCFLAIPVILSEAKNLVPFGDLRFFASLRMTIFASILPDPPASPT